MKVRVEIIMEVNQAAYVAAHGPHYEDPDALASGVGMAIVAVIGDELGRTDDLYHYSSKFSAVD